jgi:hypothetical protein
MNVSRAAAILFLWHKHGRVKGTGLDGDKMNLMTTLFRHQPGSKGRSIGIADRMHGNRRLIGRPVTKISGTSYATSRARMNDG